MITIVIELSWSCENYSVVFTPEFVFTTLCLIILTQTQWKGCSMLRGSLYLKIMSWRISYQTLHSCSLLICFYMLPTISEPLWSYDPGILTPPQYVKLILCESITWLQHLVVYGLHTERIQSHYQWTWRLSPSTCAKKARTIAIQAHYEPQSCKLSLNLKVMLTFQILKSMAGFQRFATIMQHGGTRFETLVIFLLWK